MRILIVDDDLVSRKKMEAVLRSFGSVETAEGGAAAVDAFRRAWEEWKPLDLITLDVSMPEVSGSEALKSIRATEMEKGVAPDRQVKVMMVTGMADRETVIGCMRDGCNEYVVKPFNQSTVTAKLTAMGFSRPAEISRS